MRVATPRKGTHIRPGRGYNWPTAPAAWYAGSRVSWFLKEVEFGIALHLAVVRFLARPGDFDWVEDWEVDDHVGDLYTAEEFRRDA